MYKNLCINFVLLSIKCYTFFEIKYNNFIKYMKPLFLYLYLFDPPKKLKNHDLCSNIKFLNMEYVHTNGVIYKIDLSKPVNYYLENKVINYDVLKHYLLDNYDVLTDEQLNGMIELLDHNCEFIKKPINNFSIKILKNNYLLEEK